MEARIPIGTSVPLERADLAEVLGNLLDNAVRHAASQVCVTAHPAKNGVSILVDDDGPGIAPTVRAAVLERGARLDQRSGGAGLGLAIVLDAYGPRLILDTSALGGLKATVAPPAVGMPGSGQLDPDTHAVCTQRRAVQNGLRRDT